MFILQSEALFKFLCFFKNIFNFNFLNILKYFLN